MPSLSSSRALNVSAFHSACACESPSDLLPHSPLSPSKEPGVSLYPRGQKSRNERSAGSCGSQFPLCDTVFLHKPEDIVCQCGAQLAYLLRPSLNEPAVNGLETLAAVSGTARAGVCVCVRHYESVRDVCKFNGPVSWGILPCRR